MAMFVYDNDTFIVESFRDEPVDVKIVADIRISKLNDIITAEELTGEAISTQPRFFRKNGTQRPIRQFQNVNQAAFIPRFQMRIT